MGHNKGKENPMYGKRHSPETIKKMKECKLGKSNPLWKETPGYTQLHYRMKQLIPKPKLCVNCNNKKAVDLANISGKYLQVVEDWEWLCRRCHMITDGRLYNNLINSRRKKIKDMNNRFCLLCGIKYEERPEYNKRHWYGYKDGFICVVCNTRRMKKNGKTILC